MKRHLIIILLLVLTTTVYGQTKDRRAELDIKGNVREISVSPDEKIWLVTALSNIYYTNNIDSNWHFGNPVVESKDLFDIDLFELIERPNLNRISFFNKDTAIMTGYISANNEESKKNGYYFTKDAGKNWELKDFGGDAWIYTVYTDKQGNAWMGGLSKTIYYSNDFGQSWKILKVALKISDRIYSIDMIDAQNGIIGSDDNEILITTNNWKTSKNIPTPFDQKQNINNQRIKSINPDKRISKIQIWNNYIVLKQDEEIFYSEINNIEWKSFPVKVFDFELDKNSKTLFVIDDSLRILSFSSPNNYHLITNERLTSKPVDMKAVNGSLFVASFEYEIYKVNQNGLIRTIPYTTERKIEEPIIVKEGNKLIWGINGKQLYLADNPERDWYRENVLDFLVEDFRLLNDTVAILWDGRKNNYIYSLSDHTAKIYCPEAPLQTFLDSPIQTVIIESVSSGCFHLTNDVVRYERINDSTLETKKAIVHDENYRKDSVYFNNRININSLTKILTDINSNPSKIPTIKEFQFTESNIKDYLAIVDEKIKTNDFDFIRNHKEINEEFYYAVPAMLDTLNNDIIAKIIDERTDCMSTTSNRFKIQIINQNNDTIRISRLYYCETVPWQFPWELKFNEQYFNCNSIEFSKLIKSMIPDNFNDKELFSNPLFIFEIANYLWNKEE